MNVTKDRDGVNITGLTDAQALTVMTLMGNLNWSKATGFYDQLLRIFPSYYSAWYKKYSGGEKDAVTIILSERQKRAHDAIIDEVLNMPVARPINSNQRRDAKGRFEKKVWVARFSYPDSRRGWVNVKRTVITNNSERARPVVWNDDSIEGVDLARGSFRKFLVSKIHGLLVWTREYASDVKPV